MGVYTYVHKYTDTGLKYVLAYLFGASITLNFEPQTRTRSKIWPTFLGLSDHASANTNYAAIRYF